LVEFDRASRLQEPVSRADHPDDIDGGWKMLLPRPGAQHILQLDNRPAVEISHQPGLHAWNRLATLAEA